jgi:glutamate synthase (ferredoxin)
MAWRTFSPPAVAIRGRRRRKFEKVAAAEGMPVLGWRDLPVDNSTLGKSAKASEPLVRQVFVKRHASALDDLSFERKLYVLRKVAHNAIRVPKWTRCGMRRAFPAARWFIKACSRRCRSVAYFLDLQDEDMESALALVHSRFSTNTFPNWERSHPYRYIAHNGEINTLRGNINWMNCARQSLFASELFGDDINKIKPVINVDGSDSTIFDNCARTARAERSLVAARDDDDDS